LFTVKVAWNFIKGFRKMHALGPCVTVFGSARFKETSYFYLRALEIGEALAKLGFTVMTGGGPGIMEAANKGAFLAGGNSVGIFSCRKNRILIPICINKSLFLIFL